MHDKYHRLLYSKLPPDDEYLIYSKHVENIYWNKLRQKVHPVGSYCANISRWTVHIMSNCLDRHPNLRTMYISWKNRMIILRLCALLPWKIYKWRKTSELDSLCCGPGCQDWFWIYMQIDFRLTVMTFRTVITACTINKSRLLVLCV